MTTETQQREELDRFTKAIRRLQTVEGCPELPGCVDLDRRVIIEDSLVGFEDQRNEVRNDPVLLAVLRDWVMGEVVPWVNKETHRVLFYHSTLGWTYMLDGIDSDTDTKDHTPAVLALLEAIVEVVVQEDSSSSTQAVSTGIKPPSGVVSDKSGSAYEIGGK